MKKLILATVALIGFTTHADVAGPLWGCKVSGVISGKSVSLGLSVTDIQGDGVISCESINGVKEELPVTIKVTGIGVGFGVTDYKEIEVATATIGLADGPEALVGSYSVGPAAGITLIQAGLDVSAAIKVSKEGGLGFELGFMGKKAQGLEAKLQLQGVSILPRD
ncbi:MAG: hypothetical protein AB7N80_07595 [Bdellovibrionales bacterium]